MYVGAKEQSERGFSLIEKYVCADCIEEEYLAQYIENNGKMGSCSYCEKNQKILHFDFIMELILNGLNAEYEDPAEQVSYCTEDGGFQLPTISTEDLLIKHLIGEIVLEDVDRAIHRWEWVKQDPYGPEKHIELLADWEQFSHQIKHETRYFFRKDAEKDEYGFTKEQPYQILEFIGSQVIELGLIRDLPEGTQIFRGRETIPGMKFATAEELGAPPSEKAVHSNRMSPAGISMFYGSLDEETCFAELLQDEKMCTFTIATWEKTRLLTILDLTNLPEFPSLFDEDNRWKRTPLRFLYDFLDDFTKIIEKDGREHIEYVPTQIVTEYFRRMFCVGHFEIHGILYQSSKSDGISCVFFYGPEGCCSPTSKKDGSEMLCLVPDSIKIREG